MTCIVALEIPGVGVVMGGDRAAGSGARMFDTSTPKIVSNGELMMGFTSSYRMGQLLQYALVPPMESLGWDVDRWVTVDFMGALMSAFTAARWDEVALGNVAKGGNFLLAVRGRCYEVQENYAWNRFASGEYSVGSGEDIAHGALSALRPVAAMQPGRFLSVEQRNIAVREGESRVRHALEIAVAHVGSVRPPFDLEFQPVPE